MSQGDLLIQKTKKNLNERKTTRVANVWFSHASSVRTLFFVRCYRQGGSSTAICNDDPRWTQTCPRHIYISCSTDAGELMEIESLKILQTPTKHTHNPFRRISLRLRSSHRPRSQMRFVSMLKVIGRGCSIMPLRALMRTTHRYMRNDVIMCAIISFAYESQKLIIINWWFMRIGAHGWFSFWLIFKSLFDGRKVYIYIQICGVGKCELSDYISLDVFGIYTMESIRARTFIRMHMNNNINVKCFNGLTKTTSV